MGLAFLAGRFTRLHLTQLIISLAQTNPRPIYYQSQPSLAYQACKSTAQMYFTSATGAYPQIIQIWRLMCKPANTLFNIDVAKTVLITFIWFVQYVMYCFCIVIFFSYILPTLFLFHIHGCCIIHIFQFIGLCSCS